MPASRPAPRPGEIRLIHLSLGLGILLFLIVALVVRSREPAEGPAIHLVMLGAGLPTLVLAQILRARIPARRAAQPASEWWGEHYTSAIVVWALIEGASLMGVVGFWISGNQLPLAVTAAGLILLVLTAPARLSAE